MALSHLEKKYHITLIQISSYNSHTNSIAECSHFDVRQALFKASDGEESKWSQVAQSVFWSERVTPRKRMGCSPYFAITGTHPILPFDIIEANYLLPPPDSLLSTTNLVACRAVMLQKHQADLVHLHDQVHRERNCAALCFERDHAVIIRDFNFNKGDLVLIQNTAIKKALNKKMRPYYFGPMVIVSHNCSGAYIICNLNGMLAHALIAAFQIVPYFTHEHLDLPDLKQHINVSMTRLRKLEDMTTADPNYPEIATEPMLREDNYIESGSDSEAKT